MKKIAILLTIFLLSGCTIQNIKYKAPVVKQYSSAQYYDNTKCIYTIGPFNLDDDFDIKKFIQQTIKKANNEGYLGDQLINIKIKQTGFTTIFVSRICLHLSGNLVDTRLQNIEQE